MNIGFLVFPDLEELDLVGPWEIITAWKEFKNGPKNCFTISQEKQDIRCAKGLTIKPDYQFDNCPFIDFLFIPGGRGARTEAQNPVLIDFVQKQASCCKEILSVCTGVFILEASGLLKNKKATTYWGALDQLRKKPDLTVVEERYVKDDNVWTSAGISAGIDLALAFIAHHVDEETAGKVQFYTEFYPTGYKYGEEHMRSDAPQYLK